ncbi:MAG: transglutaminase family protein, partial [Chloroflexota bacterium]|nr:transglutaminase family protein [Chloroflexota bacterium]
PATEVDLPVSATITDTIEAVSTIDFSNDPNVIHNVLLADDLISDNAAFISANPIPDRSGNSLAWNLGDIPPLGTVTATLTVRIPDSIPDFVELDTGADAWGTLEGRAISASTAPATLAPDGFGDWLQWTVDADYYDGYVVAKATELGNDWQQMFAYVRSLGYESYKGSLRGTRGTLWSEAGNSIDQTSLLIAMLRGSGMPARYRHGTLNTERAQELILSMFPEPQGTIGHIPRGTGVADPANDPQLLEETVDHWWVEAYLPGLGWMDLDPSFTDATPGQTFHDSLVTDGTDQITEMPDDLRHKVTMTVKVERWDKLSNLTGGLEYRYPLSHTFNTVELVGEPVTLGHLVNTDAMAGMAFWRVQHIYTPYFAVGDWEDAYEGEPFQDVLSNFPFGNFTTTGEWLLFDVRDAGRICRAAR